MSAAVGVGAGAWVVSEPAKNDNVERIVAPPPRLSRCRWVRPLLAGIGAAPRRCAKAASDLIRSRLSPALMTTWSRGRYGDGRLEADGAGGSHAQVTYDLTSLSAHGDLAAGRVRSSVRSIR